MNGLTRIDRETAIMIAGIAGRNVSVDELERKTPPEERRYYTRH